MRLKGGDLCSLVGWVGGIVIQMIDEAGEERKMGGEVSSY